MSTARGTRPDAFGVGEWLLLVAIAGMWGSSYIFVEMALDTVRPGVLAFAETLLGAAILALFPQTRRPIAREDWRTITILGFVWMGLPVIFLSVAQQWIDSSLAGMLSAPQPLFAALFAWMFFHGSPGGRQVAGLCLGFAGVLLIALPAVGGASATAVGVVLVLMASLQFGFSANLTVPLQQRYGSLPVVFRAQLVAALVTLPYAVLSVSNTSFKVGSALAVLSLGLFTMGLAYVAMATLVGRAGATRGSVSIYFIPIVATVLGVLLEGDTVAVIQIIGIALVIVGGYLTSRRDARVPVLRSVRADTREATREGGTT